MFVHATHHMYHHSETHDNTNQELISILYHFQNTDTQYTNIIYRHKYGPQTFACLKYTHFTQLSLLIQDNYSAMVAEDAVVPIEVKQFLADGSHVDAIDQWTRNQL